MKENKNKSVLVVFGDKLPKKSRKWFGKFSKVIYSQDLEKLTNPGNIQEANRLVQELSRLTLPDGQRIAKLANWHGYELWWLHYGGFLNEFCLPYTQYRDLLAILCGFENVYLYQPPCAVFFRYYLRAHGRSCFIIKRFKLRSIVPFPFGVLVQLLISAVSFPWLLIRRYGLMVWASDKISPPYNFEFRNKSVFKELREKKIPFLVLMRSIEPWHRVIINALKRKRPVVYSSAIIETLHFLARPFNKFSVSFSSSDPKARFWFSAAVHYFRDLRGSIWSISLMNVLLRVLGVKSAITGAGCERTFHEILGCKMAGIKTVAIQHAATPRHAFISDFMPYFDGQNRLSVDRYGLWSLWWKEYYLKYSRAYGADQLFVSGPGNPVENEAIKPVIHSQGKLRVLFVAEQLAAPGEVMPYLEKVLAAADFAVSFKFRPYRDGFEEWLKKNRPEILEKAVIFRGNPQTAAAQNDVVVGSHSSAVLEGLLQAKPIVFFWTQKWGDYFGLLETDKDGHFFAQDPEELVQYIRQSNNMPKAVIGKLREQFFGELGQDGGKWVVNTALEYLNQKKKNGNK